MPRQGFGTYVSWALMAILIGLLLAGGPACDRQAARRSADRVPAYAAYREQCCKQLADIRDAKAEKVKQWLSAQREHLAEPDTRSELIDFFDQMKAVVAGGSGRPGKRAKSRFLELNREIERYFVYRLGIFYDLLFIDAQETVFYSVKMEEDFRSSLTTGAYAKTRMAAVVRKSPEKMRFVDFQYYGASDEAAAFHILPVWRNNRYRGAIALQLSINHLNQMLTDRSGLGRTGEAYLVNKQHLMLTESRFINADTVLSKQIDTAAVKDWQQPSGEEAMTDYRGVRVLSSFRQIPIGRTTWRIIVEKDESEVISDYYQRYGKALFPLLAESIQAHTQSCGQAVEKPAAASDGARRVDVSELIRAGSRNQMYTPGLATCTGLVAYSTDGGFSYMAHLSPVDASYGDAGRGKGQRTDLLSLLLRRIRYFEIKPCQRHQLRFRVAATHTRSLEGILDRLLAAGISLGQVKAAIAKDAESVSLYYDAAARSLTGIWYAGPSAPEESVDFGALPDLGALTAGLSPEE